MKFGIVGVNYAVCSDPGVMREVALTAEAKGFESLWFGEHIVTPDPQELPSRADPLLGFIDPFEAMSYVAAITGTIKLGTGVIIVPQRNPLYLSKSVVSIDHLSKGRFLFGVGSGYVPKEFDTVGVSYSDRGPMTDEYLDAMRVLWTSEKPEFQGRFVNFHGIQSRPLPYSDGGPPVVVGGWSKAALKRTVARGEGWYGYGQTPDEVKAYMDTLETLAETVERPPGLCDAKDIEIGVGVPGVSLTDRRVKEYEEAGVQRICVMPAEPTFKTGEEMLTMIDRIAADFI